jgi:hypothetical protein
MLETLGLDFDLYEDETGKYMEPNFSKGRGEKDICISLMDSHLFPTFTDPKIIMSGPILERKIDPSYKFLADINRNSEDI